MTAQGVISDAEAREIAIGDPRLPERFWSKVEVDAGSGCWCWIGAILTDNGYGHFWWEGRMRMAHRVSYETLVAPVAEGLQLDHLCRVRRCANPAHLEPVTPGENVRRSAGPEIARARHSSQTHCAQGHSFDEANTRWAIDANGYRRRHCRACKREQGRRKRRKRKDEALLALRALNSREPVPIAALVERGLLPNTRYGRTFAALQDEGLVDSRFAYLPGRSTKIKVWWLTDRGGS